MLPKKNLKDSTRPKTEKTRDGPLFFWMVEGGRLVFPCETQGEFDVSSKVTYSRALFH